MQYKPFIFYDKAYGKIEIISPVILELINSSAMQRLKGIGQFGVPDEFYHLENYSRFDHSLGVYIILKKLGASEEEQIAGLLHDVSHTAFSHVVDWVIGDGDTENYQDTQHKKYSMDSAISNILQKYGYKPKRIFEHKNFSLLENEIPQVCADRLDYSLKEFSTKIARKCFSGLTVISNTIVFTNQETAFLFANTFLNKNLSHWGQFEAVARYRLFANALRIALKESTIDFDDFEKDDNFIIQKLVRSKNRKIQKILKTLRNKSLRHLTLGNKFAYKKFRFVDPLFLKDGKVLKLSEIDKRFKNKIAKVRKINRQGVRLPKITALA